MSNEIKQDNNSDGEEEGLGVAALLGPTTEDDPNENDNDDTDDDNDDESDEVSDDN